MQNIDDLRNCIDEVDMQILELLDKRMDFVKKIGELKNSTGTAIYRRYFLRFFRFQEIWKNRKLSHF